MQRLSARIMGGSLQVVLIASFSLVAALTVGLFALGSSRVIKDYLVNAEDEQVARDMDLAQAFYQLKLDEMAAISQRLVLDERVNENFTAAKQGNEGAIQVIDDQITNKIAILALGGTHTILVIDADGNILVGRTLKDDGDLSPVITDGSWAQLPILESALARRESIGATEVIPAEFLAQVGLDSQSAIELVDTAMAAPEPFDPREGTAGLALTGVSPITDSTGQVQGAVLSIYLFNNDYTLVDRIKQVAGVDTATIFFGDSRISTNVMTESGERAVGTRMSEAVHDVVLKTGLDYIGRAFVVNEWFITRYIPLKDHLQKVVGSLYVGASAAKFENLVQNFNTQVAVIALVCILLAGVIAIPIARIITRPLQELVTANRHLAAGDMSVRVEPYGSGELAVLGESFNAMVETLYQTQQELLHKERLVSMGQLAAGVAHEINNPLATILLYADVLRKQSSKDDPQYEDLSTIVTEVTRCKEIVANLLNFARQQQIAARETDLHALIDDVLERIAQQPNFDRIQILRVYDPDLPLITVDPDQLGQVFINLFNNAADAMTGGGTLTISTRDYPPDAVQVEICDSGSGIPPENLGRLFTPFFTTKPFGKGTGLGLSIVYGIIKMHRGQINVASTLDQGTAFTITLPVRLSVGSNTTLGNSLVIG